VGGYFQEVYSQTNLVVVVGVARFACLARDFPRRVVVRSSPFIRQVSSAAVDSARKTADRQVCVDKSSCVQQ